MSHAVWSVSLCVLVTGVSCVKVAEPVEMPFRMQTCGVQRTMGVWIPPGQGSVEEGHCQVWGVIMLYVLSNCSYFNTPQLGL